MSVSHLGSPPAAVWQVRREVVETVVAGATAETVRTLGAEYLETIRQYEREAAAAGPSFVEIQNTLLFATLGERPE